MQLVHVNQLPAMTGGRGQAPCSSRGYAPVISVKQWLPVPKIHYTRFPITSTQTGKLPTCCGLVSDTANKLATSRCNGILETTRHNRHNGLLPAPTSYGLVTDLLWGNCSKVVWPVASVKCWRTVTFIVAACIAGQTTAGNVSSVSICLTDAMLSTHTKVHRTQIVCCTAYTHHHHHVASPVNNQACRGYGYPRIYPCVDMRLRPGCEYIHGYYAGTTL